MAATNRRSATSSLLADPSDATLLTSIGTYARMVLRQWVPLGLCTVLGLGIGLTYFMLREPTYTATSVLMIDLRKIRAVQDAYAYSAQSDSLDATISSQLELMRSEKITQWVLSRLPPDIGADAPHAIRGPFFGLLAKLPYPLGSGPDDGRRIAGASPAFQRQLLAGQLYTGLNARRIGRTPLVQISFTALDPVRAARVANTFSDAFVADQAEALVDATTRAGGWLRGQLDELKQAVQKSELAVQKFKADRGLVSAGGRLVDDQKLSDMFTQLSALKGDTLRLEARYMKINEAISGNRLDPAVLEAAGNSAVELNRAKYLAAEKGEREMSRRLGTDHATVQRLRTEMQDYRRLTLQDLKRVADSMLTEVEIAKSRERTLQVQYNSLAGLTSTTNETLVELRELERASESYKTIYTAALQRNQEVIQQQSFPAADIRVVAKAAPPAATTGLSLPGTLALSLLLGSLGGLAIGALRELLDGSLRSKRQTAALLQVEPVHLLPLLENSRSSNSSHQPNQAKLLNYAAEHPRSQYAESLQALKVTLTRELPDTASRIIGIVSIVPGEGTSTIAGNLASELARMGSPTLLIDADLRAPDLSSARAPAARRGLQHCIAEGSIRPDTIVKDAASGLDFLPVSAGAQNASPIALLTAPGFAKILAEARATYEFAIIDLPALAVCEDAEAVARLVDGLLLVVEWGKTPAQLAADILAEHGTVSSKCISILLNKTDWQKLKHYESYDPQIDYGRKYASFRGGTEASTGSG